MAQTDTQNHRQTDGHGDSMTNSAQWGRVGENLYLSTHPNSIHISNVSPPKASAGLALVQGQLEGCDMKERVQQARAGELAQKVRRPYHHYGKTTIPS